MSWSYVLLVNFERRIREVGESPQIVNISLRELIRKLEEEVVPTFEKYRREYGVITLLKL